MAIEDVVAVVPELQGLLDSVYFIGKIALGAFGVGVFIWIVSIILNIRKTRLLRTLLEKLEETNDKLDKLLKSK